MTLYNTLNIKLSNLWLNKLKSGIKHDTEVTLKFNQMLWVIQNSVKLLQIIPQLI